MALKMVLMMEVNWVLLTVWSSELLMEIQMALSLVLSLVYLSAEELGHLSEGTFLSFSFQKIQTRHRLLLHRRTENCSNHYHQNNRYRRH